MEGKSIYTKADFKARREMAGYSQKDLAEALDCDIRSVKRWEEPNNGYPSAPDEAWDIIEGTLDRQQEAVAAALSKVAEIEAQQGSKPDVVDVAYYRTQHDYDMLGRDKGSVGVADANARAVAMALEERGYEVRFVYPQEGAIRTPGSRY